MSTRCTAPAARAAGSASRPTLYAPNVTVTSASTCSPSTVPSSTPTPLGTSTATTVASSRCTRCQTSAASGRSPPEPPMPTIPSRTRSAAPTAATLPAAGRAQRGEPLGVHLVRTQQQRLDAGATAGQPRTGVQRVPAVVAAAGQHQHPGPVDTAAGPAQQVGAGGGQAGRRTLHEHTRRQRGHQLLLRRAYVGDGVGPPGHDPLSSTTTAEAMPASCDSDTCTCSAPTSAARTATAPESTRCGRPSSAVTTSASTQCSPAGAPSALASASLAANRAASDAIGRSRLVRGEQPAAQSRGARQRLVEPGHVDDVDAHAHDHSTVTDFARLRGWSTSWPSRVATSQAKICSGTVATSGCSSVGTRGSRMISSA